MTGLLITLEGPDGAGKTSQLENVARLFREQGSTVITTREPGGTTIGAAIRKLLLDPSNTGLVEKTEVLLYAADRAQHVQEKIVPALHRGEVVICDRFTDSTLAYQGYGRGLNLEFLDTVNNIATGGLAPHLTLILDLPAKVGLSRVMLQRNNGMDRMEGLDLEFHQRVREGYLEVARREPGRCQVIDASMSLDQVSLKVREVVEQFIRGWHVMEEGR